MFNARSDRRDNTALRDSTRSTGDKETKRGVGTPSGTVPKTSL
jgi:hypothetical protein